MPEEYDQREELWRVKKDRFHALHVKARPVKEYACRKLISQREEQYFRGELRDTVKRAALRELLEKLCEELDMERPGGVLLRIRQRTERKPEDPRADPLWSSMLGISEIIIAEALVMDDLDEVWR